MRRRQFVAASAGALAASLAGCGQLGDVFDDTSPDEGDEGGFTDEWTTVRGDAARLGRVPADAGPGDSLSVDWELTVDEIVADAEGDTGGEFPPLLHFTSSPVLVDDLVLTTVGYGWSEEDGRQRTTRLLATDAATGEIRWTTAVDRSGRGQWFPPEVDDGLAYVPDFVGDGLGVVVIDPESGETTTELDLGLSRTMTDILVDDGTIYVADQPTTLYAFDASSGEQRWSDSVAPQQSGSFCSVVDDKLLYFDRRNGAIVARDPEEGTVLWRERLDLPQSYATDQSAPTLAPPTGTGDGIYTGGNVDTFVRSDVSPLVGLDPSSGSERFQYEPPATPVEDSEFAVENQDIPDEQLAELPPFSAVYGLPLVVDDLIVATGYGDLSGTSRDEHCFAVDRDGSLAWTAETSLTYAPVAAGEVIYVASRNRIDALSIDGERLDTVFRDGADGFESSLRSLRAPAVGNGRLYVPSNSGLVAIG